MLAVWAAVGLHRSGIRAHCDASAVLGVMQNRPHDFPELREVLRRGTQDLRSAGGPELLRHPGKEAGERRVGLGIGQLVRVVVPDSANDGLGEGAAIDGMSGEVVGDLVVLVQGFGEVGVPVRKAGQQPRKGVEGAPHPVRPPGDSDVVPQEAVLQKPGDDNGGPSGGVPHGGQAARLAHVVHPRGYHQGLVLLRQQLHLRPAGTLGGHFGGAGGSSGERSNEVLLQLGQHCGAQGGAVRGCADPEGLLVHQNLVEGLEIGQHGGPVLLNSGQQLLHEVVVRQPLGLLRDPPGDAQLGIHAGPREAVAALQKGALQLGLLLQRELLQPLWVVQPHRQRDLRQKPHQLPDLPRQALAPQHGGPHPFRSAQFVGGVHRGFDAPGVHADPALQLHEVRGRSAHLHEAGGEQRHQGEQRRGHPSQTESDVQVHHPIGEEVVHQKAAPVGKGLHSAWNVPVLLVQVLNFEAGYGGQGLGAIMGGLSGLQVGRGFDVALQRILAERGAVGLQHGSLLPLRFIPIGGVRDVQHRGPVRVVQEETLQGRLEKLGITGHLGLDPLQGGLVLHRLDRVLPIDPVAEAAQHPDQPPWVAMRVVLTQLEFNRVHGGVNLILLKAVLRMALQGAHYHLRDFRSILCPDVLQADAKKTHGGGPGPARSSPRCCPARCR
eukprot:RCo054530